MKHLNNTTTKPINQNNMPDISMCTNNKCILKKKCYRYIAIPNIMQSYSSFNPNDKGECDGFIYAVKKKK